MWISQAQIAASLGARLRRPSAGITLIEIIVVLAIVGIIIGVAIPSLSDLLRSNSVSNHVNRFVALANYARTEAVKRNRPITLCKSSDLTSCSNSESINWSHGVVVFVDSDQDRAVDAGETVLRVVEGWQSGANLNSYSLIGNSNIDDYLVFNRLGANNAGSQGSLFLCPPLSGSDTAEQKTTARRIAFGSGGRPKVVKLTGSQSCPNA